MIDLLVKALGMLAGSSKPDDGRLGKIEKELYRKFDILEEQARRDTRRRWLALAAACALLGAAAWWGYGRLEHRVESRVAERLEKEFSSARLQQVIDESARAYTQTQLKEYVDNQLSAHYQVARLEAQAKQDGRRAYEQLASLRQDARFKADAELSLSAVHRRFASLIYPFEAPEPAVSTEASVRALRLDPSAGTDPLIESLRGRLSELARESKEKYLVPDFIRFLKESESLGASTGVCRILIHNYGPRAGEYDFDQWIQYLETLDRQSVKISGQ